MNQQIKRRLAAVERPLQDAGWYADFREHVNEQFASNIVLFNEDPVLSLLKRGEAQQCRPMVRHEYQYVKEQLPPTFATAITDVETNGVTYLGSRTGGLLIAKLVPDARLIRERRSLVAAFSPHGLTTSKGSRFNLLLPLGEVYLPPHSKQRIRDALDPLLPDGLSLAAGRLLIAAR